jgi:hypothetical protein
MMNPSQRRRNALGGVRVTQLNDLGPMPQGGHIVSDRQGVLDAVASQSVFRNKGGYVQLPANLSAEQVPAFMGFVAPVLNGQFDTRIVNRDGRQSFAFKKQQKENGLRSPAELAFRRNAENPVDLTDGMNPANYPPGVTTGNPDDYRLNQNPLGGKMPQFAQRPQDAGYRVSYDDEVQPNYVNPVGYDPNDPYQAPVNMALPPEMQGYASFKTQPGVEPIYIANDDWAEFSKDSPGFQSIRQVDANGMFTGRIKNTGRRDFNFGVAQGDTINNNKGRVYNLQGEWPVENAAGQYTPQPIAQTLNQISRSQVPYGETEAKMMAGGFAVSGNSEMGNTAYPLNQPGRPTTWVDSPTIQYDLLKGSGGSYVPVDTGDALAGTWKDTAYSKADQMVKDDMLSGQYGMPDRFAVSTRRRPGATSIADVGSIGYQGAPTEGLFSAPGYAFQQNRNRTRLTGPTPESAITPLRTYSQSEPLQANGYGVLVQPARLPSAFQAPAAPVGGMDFQTMSPTSIQSSYNGVNMPSTVYQDKGTSQYPFDASPGLQKERIDANGRVLFEASENEFGVNGLNDYGNTLNAPSLSESGSRSGYLDEAYSRDFAKNAASEWQYAQNGRHIPTAYGKGRNNSTTKAQQQSEKFRILNKADDLMMLEQQMGGQATNLLEAVDRGYTVNRQDGIDRRVYDMVDRPNSSRSLPPNLFNLVPRGNQVIEVGKDVFGQAEQLHAASRQANMGFNNALQIEADVKGYSLDEIHRELVFKGMGPEAEAIARANTEAYAPPMSAFDNRLVGSFKQQQEMARRAMYGQSILDETQRRAMPLPDVEPMRVSIMDDAGDLRQQVMPVDYRDMLQARRDLSQQGYGQLQQRLPVAYGQDSDRYPVINVGHPNMKAYGYTKDGKADLAAGREFTQNNEFYTQDNEGVRQFYGGQSFPLTLGVVPSHPSDFIADQAIRIQPAYQYNQTDRQNTAGNRLRGEGYVPPAILDPFELARRNAGISY